MQDPNFTNYEFDQFFHILIHNVINITEENLFRLLPVMHRSLSNQI
jgi:hypothetical protein